MDVDALSAKGKGKSKAGVKRRNRNPKGNGKSCTPSGIAGAIPRFQALKRMQSGRQRPKGQGVPWQLQQQQQQQQQPRPSKGKKGKGKGKPAKRLGVQSLDQAWSVEEQVSKKFDLRVSEDPPWTVVRRKRRRRKRFQNHPKRQPQGKGLDEQRCGITDNLSILDTWKRIDFSGDIGRAASCIPAGMVIKSLLEPCDVRPSPFGTPQHPITRERVVRGCNSKNVLVVVLS